MKKFITTIMAMLLLCAAAFAQEETGKKPQVGIRLSYSGIPKVASGYFTGGMNTITELDKSRMEYIYNDWHSNNKSSGTFFATVDLNFAKWFTLAISVGFNSMWHENFKAITNESLGTSRGTAIYLIPEARIFYMNRPLVRLYGSIGLGVEKYFGYDQLQYSYTTSDRTVSVNNSFKLSSQFVPFGIEVGKKFFGFVEAGFGTLYYGARGGVGYKF